MGDRNGAPCERTTLPKQHADVRLLRDIDGTSIRIPDVGHRVVCIGFWGWLLAYWFQVFLS